MWHKSTVAHAWPQRNCLRSALARRCVMIRLIDSLRLSSRPLSSTQQQQRGERELLEDQQKQQEQEPNVANGLLSKTQLCNTPESDMAVVSGATNSMRQHACGCDIDTLEYKLHVLDVQRQISMASCERFLHELESSMSAEVSNRQQQEGGHDALLLPVNKCPCPESAHHHDASCSKAHSHSATYSHRLQRNSSVSSTPGSAGGATAASPSWLADVSYYERRAPSAGSSCSGRKCQHHHRRALKHTLSTNERRRSWQAGSGSSRRVMEGDAEGEGEGKRRDPWGSHLPTV